MVLPLKHPQEIDKSSDVKSSSATGEKSPVRTHATIFFTIPRLTKNFCAVGSRVEEYTAVL